MQFLNRIRLPARLENLEKLIQSVSECTRAQGFGPKKIIDLELAIEEALVNIFNYSYPEESGDVEVTCKRDDYGFIVEIIDSGIPFDITSLPEPDVTSELSERKIGGLGVFLTKKMVDEVQYRRGNDRNILHLIIRMDKG